jgi:hypothetical protein
VYVHAPVFPSHHHTSFCRNAKMEYVALTGRALAAVDIPEPKEVARFVKWVKKNIERLLPGLPTHVESLTDEEFIESGHFPKSTKVACYRAAEVLKHNPPSHSAAKIYSVFKAFLKHEKSDKPELNGPQRHGRPRLIQACSPYATLATGRWMKAFQREIHGVLKGNMLFSAGYNAEDLSKWFMKQMEGKERWYEDDFTLYDSTFSVYCHELVLWLYARCGMKTDLWAWLIRQHQPNAKGYSQYGWEYTVTGTMRSGVADTCLANSLLNYFAHLYCIVQLNPQLTLTQIMDRVSMAVMGDDNIMDTGVTYLASVVSFTLTYVSGTSPSGILAVQVTTVTTSPTVVGSAYGFVAYNQVSPNNGPIMVLSIPSTTGVSASPAKGLNTTFELVAAASTPYPALQCVYSTTANCTMALVLVVELHSIS